MNLGKRRLGGQALARYASVLVSAIALALALFVVPAQAEECTSSSCVQYSPSLPNAEGGHSSTHHHQTTPAKASKTGNGGGTAPSGHGDQNGSNEAEGSEEGESSPKQGVAGGNDGGSGQSNPGGSAKNGAEKATHQPTQTVSAKPASHSDSGGSSPLVPILIAIAVLAAISVAVVMIRQRRRPGNGPGAAASPEAN